jgi:conjugative transfer signal peptidase TraF
LILLARKNRLIFNNTQSAPLGIWKLEDIDLLNIKKSDLIGKKVAFCPSNTDLQFADFLKRRYLHTNKSYYCSNGLAPLIKTVIAGEHDAIDITQAREVIINGKIHTDLTVAKVDSRGEPLPAFIREIVPEHHLWVVGEHPSSLDSRYFGSIDVKTIIGFVSPLWLLTSAH